MSHPRLMATFRPQAWQNDYAINIDSPVDFDATEALLRRSLKDIKAYKEHDYSSDYLAGESNLRAAEEHDGPYEVDCDVDSWLEENGIEDRSKMTEADLKLLRERFGVGKKKELPHPKLSKTLQNAVCFAAFCVNNKVKPHDMGRLIYFSDRCAAGWTRANNGDASEECRARGRRDEQKYGDYVERLAAEMGFQKVEWNGLYPTLIDQNGQSQSLPSV